ncbi:hypothetical protein FACS1894126_1760 [Alphaproteobacteria bacterium]|nr:hypothetical protein FACS1894126_1760 [Alphaproteobacteria bacterium]
MKKSVLLLSAIVSFAGCMADYEAFVARAKAGDLNLSKRALNKIENPTGWLLRIKTSGEQIVSEKGVKQLGITLGKKLSEKAKKDLADALSEKKDAEKSKVDSSAGEKPKDLDKEVGKTGEALVGAAKSAAEKELAAARKRLDDAVQKGDFKAASAASKEISAISEKLSGAVDVSGTETAKPATEKALDSAWKEVEVARKNKDRNGLMVAKKKLSDLLEELGTGTDGLELRVAKADRRIKELDKEREALVKEKADAEKEYAKSQVQFLEDMKKQQLQPAQMTLLDQLLQSFKWAVSEPSSSDDNNPLGVPPSDDMRF